MVVRRLSASSLRRTLTFSTTFTLDHHHPGVLEKVVEYLYYSEKNREQTGVPDPEIPSELCLELLMAADYLDC